jgi:hypothetical protein
MEVVLPAALTAIGIQAFLGRSGMKDRPLTEIDS